MIRLLADENIPAAVVEFFRERGFDVKDVHEGIRSKHNKWISDRLGA